MLSGENNLYGEDALETIGRRISMQEAAGSPSIQTNKKGHHRRLSMVSFFIGTDVHNDTLANPHEIKVFGSRRIYFTEKI